MHKSVELTRLIHSNFAIAMSFAFSQPPLQRMLEQNFSGEWMPLRKSIFESSKIRADRAMLEMAAQLRVLDDRDNLNEVFRQMSNPTLGRVIQRDGSVCDLRFRDMTNKLMHASRFDWDFSNEDEPKLICHPIDRDKWERAEIELMSLAAVIGQIAT